MQRRIRLTALGLAVSVASIFLSGPARAAITATATRGEFAHDLDGQISSSDLLQGLIATELPGDQGWHPANTNPADQLPAFTDNTGAISGLTGLLNDFPPAGAPTKRVQYTLANPTDIPKIQILSGNAGQDGRVFSTTVVSLSTDNGANFAQLGYFQSDPSGTVNGGQIGSTLVEITDDQGGLIGSGVTDLIFELYSVSNTQGQMRDPFDGINPFTGADDGLTAAFESPLIYEIDVVPEPASCLLLGVGMASLVALRRRTR